MMERERQQNDRTLVNGAGPTAGEGWPDAQVRQGQVAEQDGRQGGRPAAAGGRRKPGGGSPPSFITAFHRPLTAVWSPSFTAFHCLSLAFHLPYQHGFQHLPPFVQADPMVLPSMIAADLKQQAADELARVS